MQGYDEICADRFKLVNSLYEECPYVRSQKVCQELYALQPNNVNVILLCSASFYMQGEYDKSLESLRKVPEEYHKYVDVLNDLPADHFIKNKYHECLLKVYQQIDKEDFAFKTAIKCAEINILKKDYTHAISALHYASKLFPNNFYPHWTLGRMYHKLGDTDRALLSYTEAKRIMPNNGLIYLNIGRVHEQEFRLEVAEEFYEKALQINPTHIGTIHNLIELKERRGLINDAIRLYHYLSNFLPNE